MWVQNPEIVQQYKNVQNTGSLAFYCVQQIAM
jgi:hypothetical protein